MEELDEFAFEIFRKEAANTDRIPQNALKEPDNILLERLKLIEKHKLKRAAVLLFGKDPEKLVTGAYVKIGYFKTDADLLFHNVIEGSLFQQVEKTMDLLFTKYFKENITYTRTTRVETSIYPEKAIREALLNALTHKDYTSGNPIQIKVYDDQIIFGNAGSLPEHWTVDNLKIKHASLPPNPDIANAFFRCGYIDTWGRGTINLIDACIEHGLHEPIFEADGNGLTPIISRDIIDEEYLSKTNLNHRQIKALLHIKKQGSITNSEYSAIFHVSDRTALRDLLELLNNGFLIIKGTTRDRKYFF